MNDNEVMKKIFISIFCFIAITGCAAGQRMMKEWQATGFQHDAYCHHQFFWGYSDALVWANKSYFAIAEQLQGFNGYVYSCGWATNKTVKTGSTDAEIMATAIGNCERAKTEKYGADGYHFKSPCKILFKGYERYDEKDTINNIDFQ